MGIYLKKKVENLYTSFLDPEKLKKRGFRNQRGRKRDEIHHQSPSVDPNIAQFPLIL